MKVSIIEATTKRLVMEAPITFEILNEPTTRQDIFDEAWKTAVEDNAVNQNNREKYIFMISE